MESNDNEIRHSVAGDAVLISDTDLRAKAESRNGLRQFDLARKIIEEALERGGAYRLRISRILDLHRIALEGLSAYAGNFRPSGVLIHGSSHQPVEAHLVPELMEEMCDYVNEYWDLTSPVHLASYIMWRLNWIHPFADGNGRTSRMTSYVVLCIKSGALIPGTNTIPEQIVANRDPYFAALEAADQSYAAGKIDLTEMEELLSAMLSKQLIDFYSKATGKDFSDKTD